MKNIITDLLMKDFETYLYSDEKSNHTITKYLRDVRHFRSHAGCREINKVLAIEFKSLLADSYEISSANSMIASLNAFLRFAGWEDCCIKQFKVQKKSFCTEEKELTKAEYIRLVHTAKQKGNERLSLIIQTICATGIRVSELQYITVEAVRKGEAVVSCKKKSAGCLLSENCKKAMEVY